MSNNVGLRFSVDDTTLRFTISVEPRQLELVTLNIIFNVAIPVLPNPGPLDDLLLEVKELFLLKAVFNPSVTGTWKLK